MKGFVEGSRDHISEDGHLCIANLTYINDDAFRDDILLGHEHEIAASDISLLDSVIESIPSEERRKSILKSDLISLIEKSGFGNIEIEDVSKYVRPCADRFLTKINELLQVETETPKRIALIIFALSMYLRKKQFENGSLEYLFIRARKGRA